MQVNVRTLRRFTDGLPAPPAGGGREAWLKWGELHLNSME